MPVPSNVSGRDIASRLKTLLAPHGNLKQFRGYASIGLNLIPPEKRSDLQLSGCHLVDCPHQGRKEVADKMIIVDAMDFAFQHQDGATLCFITGDVDYAYLLAVLQRRPQRRTIVISRGTMNSMLQVNCDISICWETDILRPMYASAALDHAMEDKDCSVHDIDTNAMEDRDLVHDEESSSSTAHVYEEDDPTTTREPELEQLFEPETSEQEKSWMDDVELLCNVIAQEGQRFATPAPRKAQIGNTLRQRNPARFSNRENIRSFFAQAIEKGVVVESGEGAFKTLSLGDGSPLSLLELSASAPYCRMNCPPKYWKRARNVLSYYSFKSYTVRQGILFPTKPLSRRWVTTGCC